MAGNPFQWKIAREIDDRGGEEWFFNEVADNKSLSAIARSLGCDRKTVYKWLGDIDTSNRWKEFKKAKQVAAHAMTEDTNEDIGNSGGISPAEAQLLNVKVRYRQWLAGKYNRKDYGEEKGPQVQVTIGSLHADALRARSSAPALPAPIVEAEFTVET